MPDYDKLAADGADPEKILEAARQKGLENNPTVQAIYNKLKSAHARIANQSYVAPNIRPNYLGEAAKTIYDNEITRGIGGSLTAIGALGAAALPTVGGGIASAAEALGATDYANSVRGGVEDYRSEAENLTRSALAATAPRETDSFVGSVVGGIGRAAELPLPVRSTFDLADKGVDVQSLSNRALIGARSAIGSASLVAPVGVAGNAATRLATGAGIGVSGNLLDNAALELAAMANEKDRAAYESQQSGMRDIAVSGAIGGALSLGFGGRTPQKVRTVDLDAIAQQRGTEYDAQLAQQVQNAPTNWNKDILRQQLAAKSASEELAAGIEKRNAERAYFVDFAKNNPAEFNKFYDSLDEASKARADEFLRGVDLTGRSEAIVKSASDELAAKVAEAEQTRAGQQEAAKIGEENASLIAQKEEERRILENAGVAVGAAERQRALVDEIYPEEYKPVGPTSGELAARDAMRREKLANEAAKARGDRNTEDILRQQMREAQTARGEVRQASADANIDRLRAEQDIASVNEDATIRARAADERAAVRQSDRPSLEATQASRDRVEEGLRMTREQAQQVTPEPNVAPEVQDVVDMLDAGVSLRDVVNDFNAAGVPASQHIPIVKQAQEILRQKKVASASSGGMNFPKPESKAPKPPQKKVESLENARPADLPEAPALVEEPIPRPAPEETPRQVEAPTQEGAPVVESPVATKPVVESAASVETPKPTTVQEKLAADRAAIEAQRAKEAAIVEQRKAKLAEQRPATKLEETPVSEPTIKVYKDPVTGKTKTTTGEIPEGAKEMKRPKDPDMAAKYDRLIEKAKNEPTTKLRDPNALRGGRTSIPSELADLTIGAAKGAWNVTKTIVQFITDTKIGDAVQNIKAQIGNVGASYKYRENAIGKMVKKNYNETVKLVEPLIKENANLIAELARKYKFTSDDMVNIVEQKGGSYRTIVRPLFDAVAGKKHVAQLEARADYKQIRQAAIDGLARDFFKGDKDAATAHLNAYLETARKGNEFSGTKFAGPLEQKNLTGRKQVPSYLEPILGRITDPTEVLMHTLRAQHKIITDFTARAELLETGRKQGWIKDKIPNGESGWLEHRDGGYIRTEAKDLIDAMSNRSNVLARSANVATSLYNLATITYQGARQVIAGGIDLGLTMATHLPGAKATDYSRYAKIAMEQLTPNMKRELQPYFMEAIKQADRIRRGEVLGHNTLTPADVQMGRDDGVVHKLASKSQTVTTAIDNANRALTYAIHEDHLKRVYPNKTQAEITKMMAERINNIAVTPTNSIKIVRAMKNVPFASYVATYMTEKARNTLNLAKYYVQDMQVAPPAERARIASKIAALGIPILGASLAEGYSKLAENVTPEEEAAYRKTRDFATSKSLWFTRDEKGNLDAYDIGYFDPLSWPRGAKNAMQYFYSDTDRDMSDVGRLVKDSVPFIAHPLIDKMIQSAQKVRDGDYGAATKDLALAFTPGNVRRAAQGEGAVAAATEFVTGKSLLNTENEKRDFAKDKLYRGTDMGLASKVRDQKIDRKIAKRNFDATIENRDGTKNSSDLLSASQEYLDATADEWKKTIDQIKAMRKTGDSVERIRKTLDNQNIPIADQEALLAGENPKRVGPKLFALKERLSWLEKQGERYNKYVNEKGEAKQKILAGYTDAQIEEMFVAAKKAKIARKYVRMFDEAGEEPTEQDYKDIMEAMQ